MAFQIERVDRRDTTSHSWELRWVSNARHPLPPPSTQLVDRERGLTFFRLAVNDNQERPPGLCLLFLGPREPIQIEVYERPYGTSPDCVMRLSIYRLGIPAQENLPEAEVVELLREAMLTLAQDSVFPWVRVELDLQPGWRDNRPSHRLLMEPRHDPSARLAKS